MTDPTHCISCDALLFITTEYVEQHGGLCTSCGEAWAFDSLLMWGDARIPKPRGILFSRPPELDDPDRNGFTVRIEPFQLDGD